MSSLKDRIVQKYAEQLSREGERLIRRAFETANFKKDKTQNLHDSYGCAVYYRGKYVYGTKKFLSARANTPRYNPYTKEDEYGIEEINKYLDAYKPKSNGFELIVAAAMYYGSFLEKGSGRLKRKYRVISGISSDIEELAKKYKGTVRDINL